WSARRQTGEHVRRQRVVALDPELVGREAEQVDVRGSQGRRVRVLHGPPEKCLQRPGFSDACLYQGRPLDLQGATDGGLRHGNTLTLTLPSGARSRVRFGEPVKGSLPAVECRRLRERKGSASSLR